jgi:hypothetical protein
VKSYGTTVATASNLSISSPSTAATAPIARIPSTNNLNVKSQHQQHPKSNLREDQIERIHQILEMNNKVH